MSGGGDDDAQRQEAAVAAASSQNGNASSTQREKSSLARIVENLSGKKRKNGVVGEKKTAKKNTQVAVASAENNPPVSEAPRPAAPAVAAVASSAPPVRRSAFDNIIFARVGNQPFSGLEAVSEWSGGHYPPQIISIKKVKKNNVTQKKVIVHVTETSAPKIFDSAADASEFVAKLKPPIEKYNRVRQVKMYGEQLCYEMEVPVTPRSLLSDNVTTTVLFNNDDLQYVKNFLWEFYIEDNEKMPYVRCTYIVDDDLDNLLRANKKVARLRAFLRLPQFRGIKDDWVCRDSRRDLDSHTENLLLGKAMKKVNERDEKRLIRNEKKRKIQKNKAASNATQENTSLSDDDDDGSGNLNEFAQASSSSAVAAKRRKLAGAENNATSSRVLQLCTYFEQTVSSNEQRHAILEKKIQLMSNKIDLLDDKFDALFTAFKAMSQPLTVSSFSSPLRRPALIPSLLNQNDTQSENRNGGGEESLESKVVRSLNDRQSSSSLMDMVTKKK